MQNPSPTCPNAIDQTHVSNKAEVQECMISKGEKKKQTPRMNASFFLVQTLSDVRIWTRELISLSSISEQKGSKYLQFTDETKPCLFYP